MSRPFAKLRKTLAELCAGFAAGMKEFRRSSMEVQEELGMRPIEESDGRIILIFASVQVVFFYGLGIGFIAKEALPDHPALFAFGSFFSAYLARAVLQRIWAKRN